MKKIFTVLALLFTLSTFAQELPFNFESDITTSDFTDFDGGVATVLANPDASGLNTSATVAKIVRNGGAIWGGSKVQLDANLDLTTMNQISMMVYTTAPVGTVVKLKLEGGANTERDLTTTVSGAWEKLTYDFTGEPNVYNFVVFMFDFGNVGDSSATSTFYFDDVTQVFGGAQIDLPVTFESNGVNYSTTDFGGTETSLVVDPTDASNTVVQFVKPLGAATWAGSTIGTSGGFATDIPVTLTNSKMYVHVWSPDAGIPVRLKIEDSNDATHTCETETNTTVASAWEVLEFDFVNEATGTAELSFGLNNGWTYNMASIFMNFDTDGNTAGEKTYYFDNVSFGTPIAGISDRHFNDFSVSPNPSNSNWTILKKDIAIQRVEVLNSQGQMIYSADNKGGNAIVVGDGFGAGLYFARIHSADGIAIVKLIKN